MRFSCGFGGGKTGIGVLFVDDCHALPLEARLAKTISMRGAGVELQIQKRIGDCFPSTGSGRTVHYKSFDSAQDSH
jgi:hypothetical protein